MANLPGRLVSDNSYASFAHGLLSGVARRCDVVVDDRVHAEVVYLCAKMLIVWNGPSQARAYRLEADSYAARVANLRSV